MKVFLGVLLGIGLSAAAMMAAISDERFATAAGEMLLGDCGIRVVAGASGGTISGFTIVGRRTGICIQGAHDITVENTIISPTRG